MIYKDSMNSALTFGVRHKIDRAQAIPDPAQSDLPLEDALK